MNAAGKYLARALVALAGREPLTNVGEQTYVEGMVGDGWRLDANESANGGLSHFLFGLESVDDYPVLSDGTAPDYDCNQFTDPYDPEQPYVQVGTIPAGEPAENNQCQPLRDTVSRVAVSLGPDESAGIALGFDAALSDGTVSLGGDSLQQRLIRVAQALEASDALVKGQLSAGILQDRHALLDAVEAELDAMEQRVETLETANGFGAGGSGGGSVNPTWFALLLLARRFFRRPGGNRAR